MEKDHKKLDLANYELNYDVDPLFKIITFKFGDSNSRINTNGLLQNLLPMQADSFDYILEEREKKDVKDVKEVKDVKDVKDVKNENSKRNSFEENINKEENDGKFDVNNHEKKINGKISKEILEMKSKKITIKK